MQEWAIITHLQSKTQNQEKQNKQLTDENTRLQDELQNIISSGEREVADLEKIYEVKRWKLINLQEKNREITLEIEDFAFKIQESEQRSELLEKETRRMKKSIIQNQDQENRVKEELDQVAMFHSASKAKLEDLRKQIATEETAMRRQEENTTRQILHEIKTSASLKAEIHSLKEKLEMEKRNVEKERAEIDKTSKEAMMEAIQIKKIVEECQRINRERAEKSTLLKNAIQELLKKHQSTEEFLGEKKKKLQSAMKELEEKHNKVAKELNVILERIKDLKQKTKDYQDSAKAMEKLEKNMQDSIPVLQTDCNTAEFKYQQAVNLIKDLQSEITNSNQRMKLTDETHNTLLKNRQKTLEKIKIALQDGLKENVQLAKDYETLQKSLLETKTQVLKCYDEKVRMESSLYDYQKLSLLQKRMHKALVEYFKQRGLYNQAGLAKFQAAFHQNSQKIVAVQEDLSKAILRISAFLYSLTDGSTATEDAAANKQPGMDAALQQKTEPTVQITV
ncbi:coiled-coil domain-containing protein 178-like [Erpetoichthys calabaricus]|uniref:coiled-coil domain-containing protein 178-like n=1 Tax=Erpetoichthys calabaricus TaxID=27687 RepID=UPI0022348C77|nr:coiled-coil domain-containing protein 178-like [Erpetoichthys calabaricus]